LRSAAAFTLGLCLAGAGCGGWGNGSDTAAPPAAEIPAAATHSPPAARTESECVPARAPGFRLCAHEEQRPCSQAEAAAERCVAGSWIPARQRATIERLIAGRWRVVVRQPPHQALRNLVVGHWSEAWLSPDGRTLLAQWSSECEVPTAFFVRAAGGRLRPVTGERDWRDAPESLALGWSRSGLARVLLLQGLCGPAHAEPGEYLIDPRDGALERLGPLPPPDAGNASRAPGGVTAADRALMARLVAFARNPSDRTWVRVPFAQRVGLGIGRRLRRTSAASELVDPAAWFVPSGTFRGYVGPFSPLDLLRRRGRLAVSVGPHPHCASPPVPAPRQLASLRRVSVGPRSVASCLRWFTVDAFVNESGRIAAITLDLWEP
jgi:hypothetical protein